MQVVKPINFTDAQITSNSFTNAYANWSSATTYSITQKVTYNKRTYESLINSNLNKQPNLYPNDWLDIGPSNSWALFDPQISTQATATTTATIVLQPGAIDTFAILNIVGSVVQLTVKDAPGGLIIYDSQQSLAGDIVLDWYQYFFFDSTTQRTQAIFFGIPLIGTCEVTLTISTAIGSPVAIGQVVAGVKSTLGKTQYGLSSGILDFSKKETNEIFGTTQFIVRAFSKRMSPTVLVDSVQLNRVQRTLYNLRAVPALWIASDDPWLEEVTVVYGFYRDFSTEISFPTYSICSLEIEGLI